MDETLMSFEERCTFKLRALYQKYGYLPFKMGKFEEYELYVRNKDFLVSDQVITFNDTNGKLMALKPDVTLSIIKNGEDVPGVKQKVCYSENVYRVSESTHRFKEILQTGLECIGDVDLYDIVETVTLAAESLAQIADNFCLEISNLDLVGNVLASVCDDVSFKTKAVGFIAKKNRHDLLKLCEAYGIDEAGREKAAALVSVYGERKNVIRRLAALYDTEEVRQMALLSDLLDGTPFSDKIKFDFSVVNDMNYYNGFVFKGFADGVCDGILAGGQYDNMMKKMNRQSGAVGFAIYLDRAEDLNRESERYDVDCLLLYDDTTSVKEVADTVRRLTDSGESVSAQKSVPEKLRARRVLNIGKKGEPC